MYVLANGFGQDTINNQLEIGNWYKHVNYQLNSIEAGTSALLNNNVDQLVKVMAAYMYY